MTFREQPDFAQQVGDLNRYGQALNQCTDVDEVVSLTIEAILVLFDLQHATFHEVQEDGLRVLETTNPELDVGADPCDAGRRTYEIGETVTEIRTEGDDDDGGTAVLAVPAGVGADPTIVLTCRGRDREALGDEYVTPIEILASHAATAVSNIHSRERLERAQQSLAVRKEMIEMYDSLLRHDIGNDLQRTLIYADKIRRETGDEQVADYAEQIEDTTEHAADLSRRVGDLIETVEDDREMEPRDLAEVLAETVSDVEAQYEDLTLRFDPEAFQYRVRAGDLLDSVFSNVLTNAANHNEGQVTVDLYAEEPTPGTVVVGMADDGSGVAASVREDLFEMGVKGDDSNGTGYGLGFVSSLTDSYGGDVEVRDSERGGADFRVSLKRA